MTTDTANIKQVHREAMRLAQEAIVAQQKGSSENAMDLYQQAFELEKTAAMALVQFEDKEPTRSILFRSAAALAKSCNNQREAERMVTYGLTGNPPAEIADELRALYDELNFERHLNIKGIKLDVTEISLSLSGNEVGHGIVRSNEFSNRLQVIEQLTYRTAERRLGKPFRTSGAASLNIREQFEPFIATPIAASFAIKIIFGKPTSQLMIFDDKQVYEEVLNEMIHGIDLANSSREEELRKHIDDKDYYENFISLAKAIAPDGDNIKQVGISIAKGDELQTIAIRIPKVRRNLSSTRKGESKNELITVSGTLRMADADKNTIRLVSDDGPLTIAVPSGLTDLVRLYWEDYVTLTISKTSKKSRLIDIDKL